MKTYNPVPSIEYEYISHGSLEEIYHLILEREERQTQILVQQETLLPKKRVEKVKRADLFSNLTKFIEKDIGEETI